MIHAERQLKRQHGGALLVSIIMIFMMSILGVSAMRGSTIERRMAANSVVTNTNFQIAESSTELSLNTMQNLVEAQKINGQVYRVDTDIHGSSAVTSWANLTYVGDGPAVGYSLGDGSATTFVNARFVSGGNSESASVRADSEIHQGANRVVPGILE